MIFDGCNHSKMPRIHETGPSPWLTSRGGEVGALCEPQVSEQLHRSTP